MDNNKKAEEAAKEWYQNEYHIDLRECAAQDSRHRAIADLATFHLHMLSRSQQEGKVLTDAEIKRRSSLSCAAWPEHEIAIGQSGVALGLRIARDEGYLAPAPSAPPEAPRSAEQDAVGLQKNLQDLRNGLFPDIHIVNKVLDDCIALCKSTGVANVGEDEGVPASPSGSALNSSAEDGLRGIAPIPNAVTLRPVVQWFANQMEQALRRNDHKGSWGECSTDYLWERMHSEREELGTALGIIWSAHSNNSTNGVVNEAVDVANFALMLADNYGPRIGDARASDRSGSPEASSPRTTAESAVPQAGAPTHAVPTVIEEVLDAGDGMRDELTCGYYDPEGPIAGAVKRWDAARALLPKEEQKPVKMVGCETEQGTIITHPENEFFEVCHPKEGLNAGYGDPSMWESAPSAEHKEISDEEMEAFCGRAALESIPADSHVGVALDQDGAIDMARAFFERGIRYAIKNGLALVEGDGWISVRDRLPERGVPVLCWNGQDILVDSFWQSVGASIYFYGSREQWNIDVTHWRPLPTPPTTNN